MQTFKNFQSNRPFVTFSWEETHLDRIFGEYAPNGSDNYVWLVLFHAEKFVAAGLTTPERFIELGQIAIETIKPAGTLALAPMSQYEVNQVWAGSHCGYEQENIRRHDSDVAICHARYQDRVKRLLAGEGMNIQEMTASFKRGVTNLGDTFSSNRQAAELFAASFNSQTGIEGLAIASEYVYNDDQGYDYSGECTG